MNAISSKQLFDVCGTLIGRKRSSPLKCLYPIHDLPAVFNNYFVQKVQSIRTDLDQQSMSLMSCRLTDQNVVSSLSSLHPITEVELKAKIVKSKPTSCSLDHLPTSLLKFLDDLLLTLTNIINSSLLSGTFPSTFTTAVVKPLLKKASLDSNNLKNFHPVSNLSSVSKITQKIVLQQLLAYLMEHNLICLSQSAYRPHHSTETALLKVTNDILLGLGSGNVSLLTLLDLSAAFDTTDHCILLNRFQHMYGISGTALSWLSSYLTNRTHRHRNWRKWNL